MYFCTLTIRWRHCPLLPLMQRLSQLVLMLHWWCWSIITPRGWKHCRYLYCSKGKGVAAPSPMWWQTYSQKNSSPRATLLIVVTAPPAALTLIHNPLTDLPQSSAIIRWNRVCSVSKYVKKALDSHRGGSSSAATCMFSRSHQRFTVVDECKLFLWYLHPTGDI